MANQKIVDAFYQAAKFLIERIEEDGWIWSSNYLREHVRCATGLKFSNSASPVFLRELRKQHPDVAEHVGLKPLKKHRRLK